MFSRYFQANVIIPDTWFFVATFRAHEHIAFDRTLDKSTGLFEFFVPADQAPLFLSLMEEYKRAGLITNLQELPNRLQDTQAKF